MKTSTSFVIALALCSFGCARRGEEQRSTTSSTASRSTASASTQGSRATSREVMEDDDDTVATPASEPSRAQPSAREADVADASSSGATAANTASDASPEGVPTAQEQPIASTDEGITLAIRRALVADESLGIRARNTTIVTRRGVVTLRGSVEDTGERSTIERHARAVEGVARVDNRIAVRP